MTNEDQTEGKTKDLKGKAKEEIGDLINDDEMKAEGQAEQLEGKAQQTWGDLKEEAREERNK